jgi:hypothetical protein
VPSVIRAAPLKDYSSFTIFRVRLQPARLERISPIEVYRSVRPRSLSLDPTHWRHRAMHWENFRLRTSLLDAESSL